MTAVPLRPLLVAAALIPAALAPRVRAQEFGSYFRGDEVGPGTLQFDEETFMNILSFEQPLESLQPYMAADGAWYAALGSLTSNTLWLEQEMKLNAVVDDDIQVRGFARQALDFDTLYTQLQAMPEYRLSDQWWVGLPVVMNYDKGAIDGGLAFTYRDPAQGFDFFKLSWVRSDLVFNDRSQEFPKSRIEQAPDNFEAQLQAELLGIGKTTLVLADEAPSRIDYVETEQVQKFSRFHARLLQAFDVDDEQRFFWDTRYEIASEHSTPTGPLGDPDAYDGDRDFIASRVEYQRELDELKTERIRVGTEYVYFREDAESPADVTIDHTELRREAMLYGGYRSPFMESKTVDLETVVYLDRLWNVRRYPNDPRLDDHDPPFQGKLSFYFRWHAAQRAEFVLSPSFELDNVGWGGGAVMLRYRL